MQFEVSEKELRLKQLRLVVALMVVIFLFIIVYTIFWIVDYNKHFGNFIKSEAEIVEKKDVDDKTCDVIKYCINGNEYYLTTEYQSKNNIGEIITIYYDKDNVLSVIYELDNRRIILPIIATIFGCVCAGLVVTYIIIIKSNKKLKTKG